MTYVYKTMSHLLDLRSQIMLFVRKEHIYFAKGQHGFRLCRILIIVDYLKQSQIILAHSLMPKNFVEK